MSTFGGSYTEPVKVNAKGEPMVDESGKPIEEEYDDLDDVRPSCYSGVKRRLFQSLDGHPLFMVIVQNHIEQELREFIYVHFKTNINNNNRTQLKEAMKTLANEIDIDYAAVAAPLKTLDITHEQQKNFIEYLTKKYDSLFSENPDFLKYINDMLSLSTGPLDAAVNSHFSKFCVFANLQGLLETLALKSTAPRIDEKTELSTSAAPTPTTPLDAPLSEKAKTLVVKAKGIAPNTPDAYEFIRQCFLSYSKANMGTPFLAKAARFLSSQVHHGEPMAQLLLKPDYTIFDETKLKSFLAELKNNIDQNQINREGDLFAILTVAKRLTGVDFYSIEVKEKLGSSVLPPGKQ